MTFIKGHPFYGDKSKLGKNRLGTKHSAKTRRQMSLSHTKLEDHLSPNWKADKVGYVGLHTWVRKHLGRPKICEHCGRTLKLLHWANKSHQYKRELTDWIRLCPKCHKAYDKK